MCAILCVALPDALDFAPVLPGDLDSIAKKKVGQASNVNYLTMYF